MPIFSLVLASLLATPDVAEHEEPSVELRSLRGYLGLYSSARGEPSGALAGEVLDDLRIRLGSFLDRADIPAAARSGGIAIYHDLALEIGSAAAAGSTTAAPVLRQVYVEVIRRMQAADQDTLSLELEMLASPGIGLEPREIHESLARLMPGLRERSSPLPMEERTALLGLLRRILSKSGWPDLESGTALTSTIDLFLRTAGDKRSSEAPVVAAKLAEWTSRLLRAEAARDGELALEPAIIHLYRALEVAGRELSPAERSAALEGLQALETPAMAEGPSTAEGSMRSVEVGEVRLALGAGQWIPALSPQLSPDGVSRHFLVPRKSYQVELIATPAVGGGKSAFWVLARAGTDSRLVLPRCIPPGMVPITSSETGRIAFLADRRPWSMRRFLLTFQRCGALAADSGLAARIYRSSALREIPLGTGTHPDFSSLVALLSNPALRDRLESTFWVDTREGAGRAAAFEIAGAILNGNTGLRDTTLALPTVAEANRILRDGERFTLAEPQFGLFNAIRLIPEPAEDLERSRYVIRTVIRVLSLEELVMENKTEIIAETSSPVPMEKCAITEKITITPPASTPFSPPPAQGPPPDSGAPNLEDPVYGAEKLERIGGGGFGEVWRVKYLGSEEAWKYIPIRPGSSERTGREAVHARRVNHRNVVKVLDIVRLPEHYVLRMELVRGRDMHRVVNEDGVLPPENAVAYGLQVAQVLAQAHRQEVVHLDLKPHNLLLCEDGARVMVTDFGISASLARDMGDAPWAAGTPYFMAPEQFESPVAVGFGIDIWSLGVTLYWMMSLSYPFRFDGREPREVIQTDSPIPLIEAVPYIPPALSRIIERMLEKDPQRRPASMDEVVHNLESFRKCPGDPAARGGDRAFALCQFSEAITRYEEAGRHPPTRGEEPGRSERLVALAREAQAEHEVQLGRIDARITEDDPAGALLALGMAMRRFSRSVAVKERWRKIDADLRQRYAAPRRTIESALRDGDFSAARRYLDQLASLLGVPGARKFVSTAPGEEAGLDGPAIQRLRGSVNEKEALHVKLLSSIEEAVQAMDFARARDALEEFQNNFPRPENLDRMKTFAGATEALAFLADYPPELVARLLSGKERATAARPLRLQKAEACCVELLSTFDPKAYPRFAVVQAQAKSLHEAIRSLLERAGPEVDAIREAHRRGNLERVCRGIESAGDTILHTDIFKDEDREAIRDIRSQIDQLAQRADRLYREGKESLERRQFSKALTAFEEALRIGVGSHGDIDLLIQASNQSADRRRQLQEELGSLELAIHSQAVGFEELVAYLTRAEDLAGLQEDPKQAETVTRSAVVLRNAVEEAVRKASSGSAEERLAVYLGLSSAIGSRKGQFLATVAGHAADLPAKLADLARAVLGAGASGKPGPGAEDPGRPKLLWGMVEGSSALEVLYALPPAASSPHASEILAEEIQRQVSASWKGLVRGGDDSLAAEMAEILGNLAKLSPRGVAERIEASRRGILARLRRRRLATRIIAFSRNAGHLMVLFTASLALAGALIMAWSALERKAVAHDLGVALRNLRKDARWSSVETMASGPGKDSAVAFQMVNQELPAFSGLDRMPDPDARFWARCASGAGILAWIAPEGSPLLGRAAIRRAIEETLAVDLGSAVSKWIEEAAEPFPIERPEPGQGVHGIEVKLEIASRVLGGLGQTPRDPTDVPTGLGQLKERVTRLSAFTSELGKFTEEAILFASGISAAGKGNLHQLAPAFWSRYLTLRGEAPSDEWRRFADAEVAVALARGLRAKSLRESREDLRAGSGPDVYEVLRLIARIREKGSAFPLMKGWSKEDPLHPVLWPLVK